MSTSKSKDVVKYSDINTIQGFYRPFVKLLDRRSTRIQPALLHFIKLTILYKNREQEKKIYVIMPQAFILFKK